MSSPIQDNPSISLSIRFSCSIVSLFHRSPIDNPLHFPLFFSIFADPFGWRTADIFGMGRKRRKRRRITRLKQFQLRYVKHRMNLHRRRQIQLVRDGGNHSLDLEGSNELRHQLSCFVFVFQVQMLSGEQHLLSDC